MDHARLYVTAVVTVAIAFLAALCVWAVATDRYDAQVKIECLRSGGELGVRHFRMTCRRAGMVELGRVADWLERLDAEDRVGVDVLSDFAATFGAESP